MWPDGGEAGTGFETFGTVIGTTPQVRELPVRDVAFYYDPVPLGGTGQALDQGVLEFHHGTVVSRGRLIALEAEFASTHLWDDALLDWLYFTPAEPCALVLDVYEDDRISIAWSVGSAASHPRPYLVNPDRYAEQEIDPASGAATIGAVQLAVVDPATTAGDQDSGWLTARLGRAGFGDLAGRRGRLRRFISEELGWVTIADGPIGNVRMAVDYSSFEFEVRDTREIERKVQIFKGGGGIVPVAPGLPFDPEGVKTLLPDAVWGGYGYDPDSGTYLVDPAQPLMGRVSTPGLPGFGGGLDIFTTRVVDLTSTPGNDIALRKLGRAVAQAGDGIVEPIGEPFESGGITYQDYVTRFPNLMLYWRHQGDTEWNAIEGGDLQLQGRSQATPSLDFAQVNLLTHQSWPNPSGETHREVTAIAFSHRLYLPISAEQYLPAPNADIELILVYRGPPSTDLPVYVEGVTAGEFARNVYSGLYSARSEAGEVVPTGIRYDEDALLQMTDVVRMRLTAVIDDARDWLEKHIYAPTGWTPALDDDGRISPMSHVPPQSFVGLTAIHDGITEPTPDWDSGTRIVNVVRFVYQRDYRPTNVSHAKTGDGLADREIVIEWEEPLSVSRYGRQVLEIKGEAFRAIGDSDANPIGGDPTQELGAILANLRSTYLRPRYAFGAPAISVPVMRSHTHGLRAGSWVTVDLSWYPDYVTRRRGLIGLAQVVALGDLDCAWRSAMLEIVIPPDDTDSGVS